MWRQKRREKKRTAGKQKQTTAVKFCSHTEGISHSKKEDHWAGEMTRSIRKAQSMVQVLFTAGGSLNSLGENQESQTRVWGVGRLLKKKNTPGKLNRKSLEHLFLNHPISTKTRDPAADQAAFFDCQTGLV